MLCQFQSTFPRGERPNGVGTFQGPNEFQSTFPRGERRITVRIRLRHPNFNPRSRVGNDRSDHVYGLRPYDISIHVPAWGTTEAVTVGYGQNLNFNPRSRVGNDVRPMLSLTLLKEFQSTFPRGERPQIFTNILCFFMQ